jgi:NuA3 HAT complex component NTO1
VFQEGLATVQSKVDERFYTTTLSFLQDLCDVVHSGISKERAQAASNQPRFEVIDPSPTKQTYADVASRRRLGKRILKSIQPLLEISLRVESDVLGKSYDDLHKELEAMIEAGVELSQPSIIVSNGGNTAEPSEDVIMVDAPGAQITVASGANGLLDENEVESGDAMDTAEDGDQDEASIEVNTSSLAKANGIKSSKSSPAEDEEAAEGAEDDGGDNADALPRTNGIKASDTPPATNGYVSISRPSQPAPPTPPQSNGSFGKEPPADVLTEGGIPWYLKGFDPRGLSIVAEQWAGREAVRSLSEELTDIDDDELKGLGLDVDGDTITASPVGTETATDTIISASGKSKASKVKKRRASTRRR